jgi:hypothetical protein
MPCYTSYIEIDRDTTSRSGLYATDLPGVELSMLQGLTKEDQDDYIELYEMIVSRAWQNMVSDISLALQNKFFQDSKIISRETSKFKTGSNGSTGLAGIKIHFDLPKYARIHIVSLTVHSLQDYASPGAVIRIYDTDEDGEELFSTDQSVEVGKNTIFIDQDFETDTLFIAYDPELFEFKETENKHYDSYYSHYSKLECTFPCCGNYSYQGTVTQINGGGLNVKYNVVCSVEKLVCENINLFKMAFWYRIGVELADEQLLGNRLNRFTTMTQENAENRSGYFGVKYTSNITEATKSINLDEDPLCFRCKSVVSAKTVLP